MSTEQRPEVADFTWFNEEDPAASRPKTAAPLSDFSSLGGGWKALFVNDPGNVANAYSHSYLNVWISGAEGNFAIGLDWYALEIDGEWIDESEIEDIWLNGDWAQDGSLVGRGLVTLTLNSFYHVDGKQYALGTLEAVDGIRNLVALVRP